MTSVPPITLPSYLGNPAVDSLATMVMELAAEVWASRDRIRILELQLSRRGQLDSAEIDAYQPTEEERQQLRKERDEFVARLFKHTSRVQTGESI